MWRQYFGHRACYLDSHSSSSATKTTLYHGANTSIIKHTITQKMMADQDHANGAAYL